jgi:hypothetical protein
MNLRQLYEEVLRLRLAIAKLQIARMRPPKKKGNR